MQQTPDFGSMSAAGLVCTIVCALAVACLALFVWGTIFKKAGYSFWMCFLMIIPLVNLIWILIFAFSKWPIHQELEMYRGRYGAATTGFPVNPNPGQMPGQAPQ